MALDELAALWKGKPGSKALFNGKLKDGRRIVIFANEKKTKDTQPDFRVMVDTGAAAPMPEPVQAPPGWPTSDEETPF
jgi:hypothetical protein